MSKMDRTLQLRRRRIEEEKHQSRDIRVIGDYVLIESNKWQGIRSAHGEILVEPIYDCIDVMDDIRMCILKIHKSYMLYDLADCKLISMPKMNGYQRHGFMLEVKTDSGVGLFSCRLRRLLLPTQYLETTHAESSRYLWVKTADGSFAFYDTVTEATIKCPQNTSYCLENSGDLMFVVIDNKVACINENGIFDTNGLRMQALQDGGRIRLSNNNLSISIVADIYGNILN